MFASVSRDRWSEDKCFKIRADLTMRPDTVGQRARRQTVPSGPPPEVKVKDVEQLKTSAEEPRSVTELQNELEFLQWYGGVEDELLEASYDEYQLSGTGPSS